MAKAPEDSTKSVRFLKTKLNPPVGARGLVERTDLDEWLIKGAAAKLILLKAPAGFGKTTVMLQWLERAHEQRENTVWLTLDEGDNDPARFLGYLGRGFQKLDPALDLGFSAVAGMGGAPVSAALLSNVLEWVTTTEIPFVLFLDEFEVIRNVEVHEAVRQVLDHLPPGRRIVIATRETPALHLARMRAREQLVEIGVDKLRFSMEETERFLHQKGAAELGREDLIQIQRCTEGWATGIQLTMLALAGRRDQSAFIRSVTGSLADIADYLSEEVLACQTEEVRDFLLNTSILHRLSGPLCEALTGRGGGQEMLAHLEMSNLFLTPLDSERRWYRYHNLFAQFLRTRLERGLGDRVAALHAKASDWFADTGRCAEATEHALAAGDPDRAASFMARYASKLVELGQWNSVVDWTERFPVGALGRQPELRLAYCWALVFRKRYAEARTVLGQIRDSGPEPSGPAIQDEILALEGVVPLFEDRFEEALRVCEENLAKITDRGSFAFGALGGALGYCLIWAGELERAEAWLVRALESQNGTGFNILTHGAACLRGLLRMIQGRLQEALSLYRSYHCRALEAFSGYSWPRSVAAGYLAEALYEADQLDEAEALLADHLHIIREHGPLKLVILSYRTLSRIHFLRHRESEAYRLLDEAELLGQAGASRLAATMRLERIRLALQRGDLEAAERAAKDAEGDWDAYRGLMPPACDPETPEVLRWRLMIRKGHAGKALSDLRPALHRFESSRRFRLALTLRILEAEALEACGKRRPALRAMKQALHFGCREGFIRAFADEGPAIAPLLRAIRAGGSEEEVPEHADLPLDYLNRIASAMGLPPSSEARELTPQEDPASPDGLTERQVDVLRLLGRGLSYQQIADRLFVSPWTVKFHIGKIIAELGVRSRAQAVVKARQLSIIS